MTIGGDSTPKTLGARLSYKPRELRFGTSGRRGEVTDLSQLEIYINVLAELEYLQTIPLSEGGIVRGDPFYYAYDLRPSSSRFVPEQQGRGGIAQAVEKAIQDAGMIPLNLGSIPTPALTCYALGQAKGSIMVTGSHIPFEKNGYKTNTSIGELLKEHEAPINQKVLQVRQRVYDQPYNNSYFDERGMFKTGHVELLPETGAAATAYIQRYTDFFTGRRLGEKRILVYQHSAVGRDLLVEILLQFGAEIIPAGRSESFIPIDTENVDDSLLADLQRLTDAVAGQYGSIDAIVSTDGDSDRPLILGLEPAVEKARKQRIRFLGGDLVGMVVAEFLEADAVVVPITCNDGVERGRLKDKLEPKTRIGSPYVIAGMEEAKMKGKRRVCGWEANGGFLTGSDIEKDGRKLSALPTRDAVLPILAALFSMVEHQVTLVELFDRLPKRYSRAALLKNFSRSRSRKIQEYFSPTHSGVAEARFADGWIQCYDAELSAIEIRPGDLGQISRIQRELGEYFRPLDGFEQIDKVNWIDGIRIYFSNGDVSHVRPSGNADELRIYAVADTQTRADAIVHLGVVEPDGILRRLEKAVCPSGPNFARTDQTEMIVIEGSVQHYEWGGYNFIPSLLGIENRERRPYAEFWIGVHPKGPSMVVRDTGRIPLCEVISRDPIRILGEHTASRFKGQLPYLFKVLDARKMLSIQAHPDKRQAEEGFAREETAGIQLDDPARNYRDDNHKPEAHVVLTDFWMLHGFRPLEEIAGVLETVPEFQTILPDFLSRLGHAGDHLWARAELLKSFYATVMEMPQDRVDDTLKPLMERLAKDGTPDKDSADFWALCAANEFPLPDGHLDRGIFSIYLLNLVRLKPGDGTYQPAGVLHAYLEGTTIEIMANSDNVLRGGLTPKHVDVPELLHILNFEGRKAEIQTGQQISSTERVYRTPCREFELSLIRLALGLANQGLPSHSADTVMVLEGGVRVKASDQAMELSRGGVFLVPSGVDYRIEAVSEQAVLYKASIPV